VTVVGQIVRERGEGEDVSWAEKDDVPAKEKAMVAETK